MIDDIDMLKNKEGLDIDILIVDASHSIENIANEIQSFIDK
jgi:hypothetical protein